MLRYLRIAVTLLSLTACVLLIALWVRSYWHHDIVRVPVSSNYILEAFQIRGRATFEVFDNSSLVSPFRNPGGWMSAPLKGSPNWADWELRTATWGLNTPGARGVDVTVPHWFLILVIALLATLTWMPWLPWRFSLRTLLIATTLVAVALGIVVAAA